jgi:MFS family permease
VTLAIAGNVAAAFPLLLALMLLHSATAFGDNGALASGVVGLAEPQRRGATLAAYALIGFTGGFLGPLAIGVVLDLAGGAGDPTAWRWAFVVVGLGSLTGSAAFGLSRRRAIAQPTV